MIKRILIIVLSLFSIAQPSFAQSENVSQKKEANTEIWAGCAYDTKYSNTTLSLNVSHDFKTFGLSLMYDGFDLNTGHKISGESIGWYSRLYFEDNTFAIIPDIRFGMAHGKFEEDDYSFRFQMQFGMRLQWNVCDYLWTGFNLRMISIDDIDNVWLLGMNVGFRF